jgi:hypothetical protein
MANAYLAQSDDPPPKFLTFSVSLSDIKRRGGRAGQPGKRKARLAGLAFVAATR